MATRTLYTASAAEVLTASNLNTLAKGWLGFATVTSNQSGIGTSETDLTGLTVTVTVPADRLIKISAQTQLDPDAALSAIVFFKEDTTQLGRAGRAQLPSGEVTTFSGFTLIDGPSAGSHTYKLTANTSTSTMSLNASSTVPAWILVEDVGPASS